MLEYWRRFLEGGSQIPSDERIKEWLTAEFVPGMGTGVTTEERAAKAAEYSAHHLKRISEKLTELGEKLDHVVELKTSAGGHGTSDFVLFL